MIFPNQLLMIKCITLNVFGPIAAAKNQATNNSVENINALPVIRMKMDEIDVTCGRYIVR
jgi:hypothetical protein